MCKFYTIILATFFVCIGISEVRAQYGEHGKPRMLLIQLHSDISPPMDEESDVILKLIAETSIKDEVKPESFMYQKASYTVFLKEITPIAMPDGYYDELKNQIKKQYPKASFEEIEFDSAYKLLGKSPFSN